MKTGSGEVTLITQMSAHNTGLSVEVKSSQFQRLCWEGQTHRTWSGAPGPQEVRQEESEVGKEPVCDHWGSQVSLTSVLTLRTTDTRGFIPSTVTGVRPSNLRLY